MPAHSSDPTDVFPRRNLPGSAEQWGRTVETRQVATESGLRALQQGVQGLNRSTASQIAGIQRNLDRIIQGSPVTTFIQPVGAYGGWGVNAATGKPAWATHALVTSVMNYRDGETGGGIYYAYLYASASDGDMVSASGFQRALGSYIATGSTLAPVEGTFQPALIDVRNYTQVNVQSYLDISTSPGSASIDADVGVSVQWLNSWSDQWTYLL